MRVKLLITFRIYRNGCSESLRNYVASDHVYNLTMLFLYTVTSSYAKIKFLQCWVSANDYPIGIPTRHPIFGA